MALEKVPGWMGNILSRARCAFPNTKTVTLGGVATVLEGAADDPYFQAIEGQATALDGLAALVARQVPRGSTVIDVGANIGLSTILLARMAERVIAFEPSPPNVAFLRRNLERNGTTNVEVHAAALLVSRARCVSTSRSSAPAPMSWPPATCRATPFPPWMFRQ